MEVKRCAVGGNKKKTLYLSGLALTPFYDVIEGSQTFTTEWWLDSKRNQKCRELQGLSPSETDSVLRIYKADSGWACGEVGKAFV